MAVKQITVKYLSGKFYEAVVKAGYKKGQYVLRLIRHKGLTDEAARNEANNKGGHRTESARRKYQVQKLPKRVQNPNTLINPLPSIDGH